jgi:hypothetical protein
MNDKIGHIELPENPFEWGIIQIITLSNTIFVFLRFRTEILFWIKVSLPVK